jgi:hypothetical protein
MKDFWDELRIIPLMAWPVALLLTIAVFALFFLMPQRVAPMSRGEIALFIWGALIFFCYVMLIVYINVDARRRGMRHVMWTLLTIFIPYFIGAILYFVLREPLMISCPKCGLRCKSVFVFCPECGAGLSPSCPACKRPVIPNWHLCAYCGTVLNQESGDPMLQS